MNHRNLAIDTSKGMSNFPIGSLFNHGQPGAAAPTPSQPTPGHATIGGPMHTAGAQSINPQFPIRVKDEALQKAIQEYVSKLSNEDKAAFHSSPDIIERLQEMERNSKSPISSSLTARVETVLQCIKHFMGSLAIFIQHHPEISSLVVGGVNCILIVRTSSTCHLSELKLIYYSLPWGILSSLNVLLQ